MSYTSRCSMCGKPLNRRGGCDECAERGGGEARLGLGSQPTRPARDSSNTPWWKQWRFFLPFLIAVTLSNIADCMVCQGFLLAVLVIAFLATFIRWLAAKD